MFGQLRISVVIPAFNEAAKIAATVEKVPELADHVVVVDDASTDETSANTPNSARIELVRHDVNRGVGAAISTGYRRALAAGSDVAVVMAGDGQMDPEDLPALLAPIAAGEADYVKGNRFKHPEIWTEMPTSRIVGNVLLSAATRVTSGYSHVFDSQCGYTAITRRALAAIDLDRLFPRYGYPNDLLARLHAAGMRVTDVPVRPVYGATWKSGIRAQHVIYPITWVLARSWAERVAAESRRRAALPEQSA